MMMMRIQSSVHRWNQKKSKLIKWWVVKQSFISGLQRCAVDACLYELKCSMYRRGPVGFGRSEVMRRGREGGYYSILCLIRVGPE